MKGQCRSLEHTKSKTFYLGDCNIWRATAFTERIATSYAARYIHRIMLYIHTSSLNRFICSPPPLWLYYFRDAWASSWSARRVNFRGEIINYKRGRRSSRLHPHSQWEVRDARRVGGKGSAVNLSIRFMAFSRLRPSNVSESLTLRYIETLVTWIP